MLFSTRSNETHPSSDKVSQPARTKTAPSTPRLYTQTRPDPRAHVSYPFFFVVSLPFSVLAYQLISIRSPIHKLRHTPIFLEA